MKIYLAGPEVFLQNAHEVFAEKLRICQKHNVIGITPFDNEIALYDFAPRHAALQIFTQNIKLIDQADAVIANITPFRGVHMDPGTAFEIGYAFAQNKQISAYSQDPREIKDRIQEDTHQKLQLRQIDPSHPHVYHDLSPKPHDDLPRLIDAEGLFVEDFGMTENLMIKSCLNSQYRQGVNVCVPKKDWFVSVVGFEEALLSLINPLPED